MKMMKEDYGRLEKLIKSTLYKNPKAQEGYKAKGLSHIRFVWDTWHITVSVAQKYDVESYVWLRGLHDHLNDSHIETALKHIIPELKG